MTSAITRGETGWSNAAEDRVELVEPDKSWREQFKSEAAAIRLALGVVDGIRLEHFGSTAVPNLWAKPIIDILLIYPKHEEWPRLREPLESLGYAYWAENPRKDQMFFVKGMPPFGTGRTHHVHVRLPGDAERELLFRDRLRSEPSIAREYEQLKRRLAQRHPKDRDAYTAGKTEFVARIVGRHTV